MAITQSTFNIIKMGAGSDALTGLRNVNFILWHSKGAVAGDDLLIKDAAGNELWADTADAANYKNFCPIKNTVNGITLTTMDSGTVYVYLEKEYPGNV